MKTMMMIFFFFSLLQLEVVCDAWSLLLNGVVNSFHRGYADPYIPVVDSKTLAREATDRHGERLRFRAYINHVCSRQALRASSVRAPYTMLIPHHVVTLSRD